MLLEFVIGNEQVLNQIAAQPLEEPFSANAVRFLDDVSRELLSQKPQQKIRMFPDVATFAFWCRKANLHEMSNGLICESNSIRLGRGCVFHIAPSNVAVNYAYSFAVGCIAGNCNIVRLPSRNFEQVKMINSAIEKSVEKNPFFAPRVCFVKYAHEKEITDRLSAICDVRVIWGGDATISEIRKSHMRARASEITFADRYSIAAIDSLKYIEYGDKRGLANDFYNDTYMSDQNACTSPRVVIWLGDKELGKTAQEEFWKFLLPIVEEKYQISEAQAVSKLTSAYKASAVLDGIKAHKTPSNLLTRLQVEKLSPQLMDYANNGGFFFEYYAEELGEILPLCSERCQTLSYFGVDRERVCKFISENKPKGIDRCVPIGKTMDFSLNWDGHNLIEQMTRIVSSTTK